MTPQLATQRLDVIIELNQTQMWEKYKKLSLPLLATLGVWAFFIWYAVTTLPQLPDQIPEVVWDGKVKNWNSKYAAAGIFGGGTVLFPVFMLLIIIFRLSTTSSGDVVQGDHFSEYPEDYELYKTYLRGYLMWMGFAVAQLMTEIFVITLEGAKLVDYSTGKAESMDSYKGLAVGVLILEIMGLIAMIVKRAEWIIKDPKNKGDDSARIPLVQIDIANPTDIVTSNGWQ